MSSKARTTRKVVGSLAIAGTAAAVAGLGTFGTFNDSTTPVATTVQTGTLDINLNQPTGAYPIPLNTNNFVPGDSITRAVNLSNDGTTPLASVMMTSASTGATNLLTSDTTKGLQLAVKSCSVAWTQGGTAAAPSYTCSGTTRTLYSGPAVVANVELPTPASLTPQAVDYLVFSVSLPTAADNAFQNLNASLSLTFTGTQRAAAAQ